MCLCVKEEARVCFLNKAAKAYCWKRKAGTCLRHVACMNTVLSSGAVKKWPIIVLRL